jgi:hypothetical protein
MLGQRSSISPDVAGCSERSGLSVSLGLRHRDDLTARLVPEMTMAIRLARLAKT